MQYKKNQMSVGVMVQRCHRWRQKRKQFIDSALGTSDEIEHERLLQMAEHYGRMINEEQSKIDSKREPNKEIMEPLDEEEDSEEETN